MTIPNNNVPTLPQLKDLLDRHGTNLMRNMNCHAIATIVSFNPALQTATVQINYSKTIFTADLITGTQITTLLPYPPIMDAPVVVLGGGLSFLTFPILPGDECLVLFNDRDMDNWFGTGAIGAPVNTARQHSFSDAMVLVGVRSTPRAIPAYSATHAELRNGVASVGVSPAQVKISNTVTTLGPLVQSLIVDINALITALTTNAATFIAVTGPPGLPSPLNPAIVAALTAVTVSLTALAIQFGALLE